MPDPDKILEAEQSIQNIASELERMRDAAKLLQNAQKQTAAVVDSAHRLIKEIETFSSRCGIIIDKLSSVDLGQKLNDLKTTQDELNQDLQAGIEEARMSARGTKRWQVATMIMILLAILLILLKI